MWKRSSVFQRCLISRNSPSAARDFICPFCRSLSTSAIRRSPHSRPFGARLRAALKDTKIQWRPIPIGLGIASVGALQFYRIQTREKERRKQAQDEAEEEAQGDPKHKPKKRKRIKPSGPWQVQVMSTLPLKGLSRIWGVSMENLAPTHDQADLCFLG